MTRRWLLKYFIGKAKVCRQVPQSTQFRDVIWASNSCVLTFNTIGIWPESADGTDVNACERSNNSKLMATGDDFGKVKLYSYPVKQPKVIEPTKIISVLFFFYEFIAIVNMYVQIAIDFYT